MTALQGTSLHEETLAFAMRHLSPLLPAFYEAHPAIELDLLLTESPVDLVLRDGALSGLGPTLLADWVIGDDLASGALVDLFPGHAARTAHSPTTAWAVYPSRSHVPAKVQAFVAFLQAALGGEQTTGNDSVPTDKTRLSRVPAQ